jgi:hypothetical protein
LASMPQPMNNGFKSEHCRCQRSKPA